jgi:hypothetical protein
MELGVEGVTRLVPESFNDASKLRVGGNNPELRIGHVCPSNRRVAENNGTSAVDPTVCPAGHVDCIDSLCTEEFSGPCTTTTERTDDIDRTGCGDFISAVGNRCQSDVDGPSNMAVGVFVVLTNVDEDDALGKQLLKSAEIDFWN